MAPPVIFRCMEDPKTASRTLHADFPDLSITSLVSIGKGWNNVAYLVNNEIVFRLPTDRDSNNPSRADKVKREVALLNLVHDKLEVASPKPLHIAPDYSYFGY